MNKRIIVLAVFMLHISAMSFCQQKSEVEYKLDWKKDIIITGSVAVLATGSLILENSHEIITEREIDALDRADINKFDRSAVDNYSSSANTASDYFRDGAYVLPAFLMFSPKARQQAGPIAAMYLEAISLSFSLTHFVKASVRRVRPYAYNPNVPLEDKLLATTKRSFFSGHVTHVSTLSFFTAKVFSDLHSDSAWKPYVWGAAFTAPAITGYLRYKAGKHFQSDAITGYFVGAAIGYFIPVLHAKTKESNVSLSGSNDQIGLVYVF